MRTLALIFGMVGGTYLLALIRKLIYGETIHAKTSGENAVSKCDDDIQIHSAKQNTIQKNKSSIQDFGVRL